MLAPLYCDNAAPQQKPGHAHAGLWFERFFNRFDTDWTIAADAKQTWIKSVTGLQGDRQKLETYALRQQALIAALQGVSHCYTTDWHFVTGMGNPHPVENGFSWHPTLAVPYLAGSAVKGLVRAWVESNDDGLSPDEQKARLKHWFGTEDKEQVAEQAGDFIFFDAIPSEPPVLLCDIMTPHMGKWYEQGDENDDLNPDALPADWHEPIPVPFLAVKKAQFIFSIAARNAKHQAELTHIFTALNNALSWLGAGAKTAAGYGYMNEGVAEKKFMADLILEQTRQVEQEQKKQELEDKLKYLTASAQDYFRKSDDNDWENNKDKFLQNGALEKCLEDLELAPDADILTDIVRLLNKHIAGLLDNPDKVQGRKAKPVYSDRQQKIAQRIKTLQAKP